MYLPEQAGTYNSKLIFNYKPQQYRLRDIN